MIIEYSKSGHKYVIITKYIERKKKRNTKFDIDFQNNKFGLYFHKFFTTWKSN